MAFFDLVLVPKIGEMVKSHMELSEGCGEAEHASCM